MAARKNRNKFKFFCNKKHLVKTKLLGEQNSYDGNISKGSNMKTSKFTQMALSGLMLGGLSLTACDNGTSSSETSAKTGIVAAKTLAEFQTECAKITGSMFKTHDCQGMNSCNGHSYQEGKGVASHDCSGHSACAGGSCIEPAKPAA